MTREAEFLGEWRQIRPDPAPARIVVSFEADGLLVYTFGRDSELRVELTWRLDADTIAIADEASKEPRVSRFHFRSRSMLVLEREGETYVYVRC